MPGTTHSVDALSVQLRELVEIFAALPPVDGPRALWKTILVTLAELEDMSVIDRIQRSLKPEFIRAGLMIGQFYPGCGESGLWNPDFRPLDCPIPLLAIRQMVSSDFPFLSGRADWVEIYLRHHAPGLPARTRSQLAGRFAPDPGR